MKTFKKSIAVVLAALMILVTMPFTALAATGDYEPNIDIRFGTVSNIVATGLFAGSGAYADPKDKNDANLINSIAQLGLYGPPVDYNKATGTLTLKAAKCAEYIEGYGVGSISEDYTYGVGDYFTATFIVENIETLSVLKANIQYSENIEPAGLYRVGNGMNGKYCLRGMSDVAANAAADATYAAGKPVRDMSAVSLYKVNSYGGDPSKIDTATRVITLDNVGDIQPAGTLVTSIEIDDENGPFFWSPEDGSFGYDFTNQYVSETFIFKIKEEGPVRFKIADTEAKPIDDITNNYYVATLNDGATNNKYTTYAVNNCKTNYIDGPREDGLENPGSCKMTFMGENEFLAGPTPSHEHVFDGTPVGDGNGNHVFTCTDADCNGIDNTKTVACTPVTDPAVAPGCESTGLTEGSHCSVCSQVLVAQTEVPAAGHAYDEGVITTDPTCTDKGVKTYTCSACNETYTEEVPAAGHTPVTDAAKAPTCEGTGLTEGKHCSFCGEVLVAQTEIPAAGHTPVTDAAKAPTCTETGLTEGSHCSVCSQVLVAQTEVPAAGHAYDEGVITTDPTCTDKGVKTYTCSACNETYTEEVPAAGHTPVTDAAVEPTFDSTGLTEGSHCSVCGTVLVAQEEVAPLKSYTVTVDAVDMGTVTLNGEDVTAGASVKFAPGAAITLEATPADGAQFLGWKVNGASTINTATTHNATVLANIVYTPMFDIADDTLFTVQFIDAFGNVIDTQDVASGADVVVPAVPVRPGYTADGWLLTDEEIAVLDTATVITAQYTADADKLYTITAAGCTLSAPGFEAAEGSITVPYDTKVTVAKDGAQAWTVKDAQSGEDITVAYGDSYTFFVTADLDLTATEEAVDATPTIANVGVADTGVAPKVQAVFKATRNMADGYKYVNSGFIYGKGDIADATLDNVDGSAIKAVYNKTTAEQFTLTFGAASQSGEVSARAFLVYSKNGVTTQVYADTMVYTYH